MFGCKWFYNKPGQGYGSRDAEPVIMHRLGKAKMQCAVNRVPDAATGAVLKADKPEKAQ